MRDAAAVRAAAMLTALGLDGMRYLATEDPLEALTMQLVAERAARLLEQRDRNLAILIGNAIARCFRG